MKKLGQYPHFRHSILPAPSEYTSSSVKVYFQISRNTGLRLQINGNSAVQKKCRLFNSQHFSSAALLSCPSRGSWLTSGQGPYVPTAHH